MNKKELREKLNHQGINFNSALYLLRQFVLEDVNKAIIVNYMVKYLQENKKKNLELFPVFYEATKALVRNTRISRNDYSEKTLLSTLWESVQFHKIVVDLVKKGYKLLPVNLKEGQSFEKEEDKEDKPLTKKEKQIRQAELMRAAKAKKREEKLKREQALEEYHKKKKEGKISKKPTTETTKKEDDEKMSKDMKAHIELLKGL